MIEAVSSDRNPLLKEVRRAVARGTLTDDGFAVAEGFHLLEEALASDCEIRAVIVSEPVRSAVSTHVRGLKRTRVVAVRVRVAHPARPLSSYGRKPPSKRLGASRLWRPARRFRAGGI